MNTRRLHVRQALVTLEEAILDVMAEAASKGDGPLGTETISQRAAIPGYGITSTILHALTEAGKVHGGGRGRRWAIIPDNPPDRETPP